MSGPVTPRNGTPQPSSKSATSRDERRIDDTVLRQLQTRLDIEEVRLSRREMVD